MIAAATKQQQRANPVGCGGVGRLGKRHDLLRRSVQLAKISASLDAGAGCSVGHTCFRNSIDGTGWSRKIAWTDRTAPTAPFRTAAASSSYVLSVRLWEQRRSFKKV